MSLKNYSAVTKEIYDLSDLCMENSTINPELYGVHKVKRGLRDLDGKGVVTGLTEISTINSYKTENGVYTDMGTVNGYVTVDFTESLS